MMKKKLRHFENIHLTLTLLSTIYTLKIILQYKLSKVTIILELSSLLLDSYDHVILHEDVKLHG